MDYIRQAQEDLNARTESVNTQILEARAGNNPRVTDLMQARNLLTQACIQLGIIARSIEKANGILRAGPTEFK
jgi:hypothetical protein